VFSGDFPIEEINVSFILSRSPSQHTTAKRQRPPIMWANNSHTALQGCKAKTNWKARVGVVMWSHLLACALLLLPAQALAGAKEKIAALAPSGLVLVIDENGHELVVQNADKPFVPASVAKIVTAWLAMEVLGADYRFETRFYLNTDRVLYIRGGGDPFLISEELSQLASALVATIGKQPLSGIVLDASYYPSDTRIPGIEDTEEAYDALNSALVSLEKSLQVANEQLDRHGLAESIRLEEGSGISRGNRFTARGLAQLLRLFEPHASLLRRGDGARFKTGTFSGVSTLAGYADTSKHGRVRFVIALTSNDGGVRFRLLKAIRSEL
jgi:D-alanyl-D-alanine carboxypeptidase